MNVLFKTFIFCLHPGADPHLMSLEPLTIWKALFMKKNLKKLLIQNQILNCLSTI